jgi:hypothetical protein
MVSRSGVRKEGPKTLENYDNSGVFGQFFLWHKLVSNLCPVSDICTPGRGSVAAENWWFSVCSVRLNCLPESWLRIEFSLIKLNPDLVSLCR